MPPKTSSTSPYRPPSPSEGEAPTKVCPDCITDPEHHSEGGVRPIEEFWRVRAARYANGVRRVAYCKYHVLKRRRQTLVKKGPVARKARKRRSLPKELARKWRKQHRARMELDPDLKARNQASRKKWEDNNTEARKAYKRQWYQDKVDAEIAAGLRPPRKIRRLKPEEEPSQ